MYDLNGDNALEVVEADSSGELSVLKADGTPLASFNGGQPVRTQVYANVHPGAPSYAQVAPPREVLRTPAIGDIDGDLEPEIVDTAGEHVYAWNADGSAVPGFPVRIDPALSAPALRARDNHIKRGFIASPTLGDLDRRAGPRDRGAVARPARLRVERPGPAARRASPRSSTRPALDGAEIITTAAAGNIAGDARPEIVVSTSEFDPNPAAPGTPTGPLDLAGAFRGGLTNILANALGGSGRTYALGANGAVLPGWPIVQNGVMPDALPLVGPGVDQVLANVDADPLLEVIGNVATGDVEAHNGDGSLVTTYDASPAGGEHVDKARVLNLFENPIVADLDTSAAGPEVIKGGLTLNQLVNLGVAVGQNLPYNHVVQAWNGQNGTSLPAFPQAVEDYQLLSSPAVADVSDAAGKEILVGTGLYYLRNINASGAEGAGWPKFTGGWIFGVPTIGDADGDGNLEVAALTREGNSFLWDTDRPACGGGNDEWWTSRHDEWSTGAYGTDSRPPGTPTGLSVTRNGRGRDAHVHGAGRRLALRHCPPLPDRQRFGADRSPRRRHRGGRLRRDRVRRPDRDAHSCGHRAVRRGWPCSIRTTPATGAASRAPPVPAPTSGFLFGRGAPGTSFSATSGNVKRATRYFLFFPATVTALRVHLDGNGGGTGKQLLRGVIYKDQGGQPTDLVRRTFQFDVPAGLPVGWVTLYLPYTVSLSPGYYWLGIQTGLNHNVARYSWVSRAGSRRYNLDAFADGPASPFGPPITDDQSIAIHALGF